MPRKHHRRNDTEDRAVPYRLWRWDHCDDGMYVMDIDHIEYRYIDNKITPVACLELTLTDDEDVGDGYLSAIIQRYKRDSQRELAVFVANKLGCKAWIVLFNRNISKLWVYNLTDDRGWWKLTPEGYEERINNL